MIKKFTEVIKKKDYEHNVFCDVQPCSVTETWQHVAERHNLHCPKYLEQRW